jgi:hypothetical protein
MVINFKARGINRDAHKLAQTYMLNLKKRAKQRGKSWKLHTDTMLINKPPRADSSEKETGGSTYMHYINYKISAGNGKERSACTVTTSQLPSKF